MKSATPLPFILGILGVQTQQAYNGVVHEETSRSPPHQLEPLSTAPPALMVRKLRQEECREREPHKKTIQSPLRKGLSPLVSETDTTPFPSLPEQVCLPLPGNVGQQNHPRKYMRIVRSICPLHWQYHTTRTVLNPIPMDSVPKTRSSSPRARPVHALLEDLVIYTDPGSLILSDLVLVRDVNILSTCY